MDKIYTVPEVALYLKISKSKLYDYVKQGKIPYIRIGRNVRIREADLIDWLEKNQINEPADIHRPRHYSFFDMQ